MDEETGTVASVAQVKFHCPQAHGCEIAEQYWNPKSPALHYQIPTLSAEGCPLHALEGAK